MSNSIRYIAIITVTLLTLAVFNNCSDAVFSSTSSGNNHITDCTGSDCTTTVTLSPIINAVAFEDLYYPPGTTPSQTPDFDYNDFMTEFKIQDVTNSDNQITDIYIDFYPRVVGAGYDHTLYLILSGTKTTPSNNSADLPVTKPMFNGSATVTLTYYDGNGNVIGTPTNPAYDQDIVLFESTHAIFGGSVSNGMGSILDSQLPSGYTSGVPSNYIAAKENARVHIALTEPSLNPVPANGQIDPSTFRVILHPIPTNYDIDIIDVDPNNFVGSSGYPWGFIIPTDWQWMTESQKIDTGYPEFAQYRNYLAGQPATGDYMHWYNAPISPADPKILYPVVPWTQTMPAIP